MSEELRTTTLDYQCPDTKRKPPVTPHATAIACMLAVFPWLFMGCFTLLQSRFGFGAGRWMVSLFYAGPLIAIGGFIWCLSIIGRLNSGNQQTAVVTALLSDGGFVALIVVILSSISC